jgi:hypothetical protein
MIQKVLMEKKEPREKVQPLQIKHKLKEEMTILFNPKEEISYLLDGLDLL